MASRRKGGSVRHAHKQKRSEAGTPARTSLKTCEACGKQCYATREAAKHAARVNHPGAAMHFYQCDEGNGLEWWHSSSIPANKLRRLRDREHRGERPLWEGH